MEKIKNKISSIGFVSKKEVVGKQINELRKVSSEISSLEAQSKKIKAQLKSIKMMPFQELSKKAAEVEKRLDRLTIYRKEDIATLKKELNNLGKDVNGAVKRFDKDNVMKKNVEAAKNKYQSNVKAVKADLARQKDDSIIKDYGLLEKEDSDEFSQASENPHHLQKKTDLFGESADGNFSLGKE